MVERGSLVRLYRRHFVNLELVPVGLQAKNGDLRCDQREIEELVLRYHGVLSTAEWLYPLFQHISPSGQAVGFISRTCAQDEKKFLYDLALAARNVKDCSSPERKALYARWACATAAIELLKGAGGTDKQEISELLSLSARKIIFMAADATQYYEGRGIDREWLNGFIKENILGSTDGSNLASKFENFINDPPRTPH